MRPVTARPPALAPDETGAAPTYLTAGQVGAMLQLSAKSIYRLPKQDPTFPQLKLAGSVRFRRERLMRWLRSREQGPGQQRTNVRVSRDARLRALGNAVVPAVATLARKELSAAAMRPGYTSA